MKSNIFYLGWLVFAVLLPASLMWITGDVYVTGHESDVLHSLQGAIRLLESERPHLDFATPLGVLTFLPITVLLGLGFGHGAAMAYSGVLCAIVFLPAMYWVGITRFQGGTRWVWAAVIILLFTASVVGATGTYNSYSMHYNRWAWAVTFILLPAIAFPNSKGGTGLIDGLVIGFGLSCLALMKITFFLGVGPVVLAILLMHQQWRTIVVAMVVGGLAIVAVTVWASSVSYWFALFGDLKMAGEAEFTIRAGGWSEFVSRVDITFALLAMLAGAVLLSRAGETRSSLVVLLLTPAFLFITYYNWNFEPKFLLFLALVMWVSNGLPRAISVGYSMAMIGFFAPVLINLALSNLRPIAFQKGNFHSVFTEDIKGALQFDVKRSYDRSVTISESKNEHAILFANGYEIETKECFLNSGYWGQTEAIMSSLTILDLEDNSPILVADSFSDYWMFGNFGRLKNGAIWQYGGRQGIENAEILIVPDCVAKPHVRRSILEVISNDGYDLELIEQTAEARIYRVIK